MVALVVCLCCADLVTFRQPDHASTKLRHTGWHSRSLAISVRISGTLGSRNRVGIRRRASTRFVRFALGCVAQLSLQPCQKGAGRHAERHVAVPAVPGAGLAVIKTKLFLGALEAFFDRPA